MMSRNTTSEFYAAPHCMDPEVRDEIYRLNEEVRALETRLKYVEGNLVLCSNVISDHKEEIVKALVEKGGGKILGAVKALKHGLGLSLREAKEEVESIIK